MRERDVSVCKRDDSVCERWRAAAAACVRDGGQCVCKNNTALRVREGRK